MTRYLTSLLTPLLVLSACDAPFLRDGETLRGPNDLTSCAPNGAVRDLSISVHADHAALVWASDSTDEDGFLVERRVTGSIVWGELVRLAADNTTYSDYSVEVDKRYGYRVKSYRTAGLELCESIATDETTITTVPDAVDSVTTVTLGGSMVELRWRDSNSFESGVRIERDAFGEGFVALGEVAADGITFTDPSVEPGWSYTYRLTAFNASGSSEATDHPYEAARAPELSWGKAPYVEVDCTLVVPGVATFDPRHGAVFGSAAALLSVPTVPGTVQAGPSGFEAVLDPPIDDVCSTTWTVRDSLDVGYTLTRDLSLKTSQRVRALERAGTREPGDDASSGAQALLPACANCQGRRGMVNVGSNFSCVKHADGELSCWGRNGDNETGRGRSLEPYLWPQRVCDGAAVDPCANGLTAIDLEVTRTPGYAATCVRSAEGRVWCWGRNDPGRLGDGTTHDRAVPTPVCREGTGADCVPLTGVRELALGGDFTCGRLDSGEVLCWGRDSSGQLGDGDDENAEELNPVPVCAEGSGASCVPLTGVVALAAGAYHVCALVEDGATNRAVCWGDNSARQLGNGTIESHRHAPVDVCESGFWDGTRCNDFGADAPFTGAVALAAGVDQTCAVMADGTARCWGENGDGQLGSGNTADSSLPQSVCASGVVGTDCVPMNGVVAIGAGNNYTCALLGAEGEVQCWGEGIDGKLGNGLGAGDVLNPAPVCLPGSGCPPLRGVARIYVAGASACAVRGLEQDTLCWGGNDDGKLGIGNLEDQLRPMPVCWSGADETCDPLGGAVMVKSGTSFSCALLEGSGEVFCWGASDVYSGISVSDQQDGPLKVCAEGVGTECVPLASVAVVSAGNSHACALLDDGGVRCWGQNDRGQLGNGAFEYDPTPVGPVCLSGTGDTCEPLTGVSSVSAGGNRVASAFYYYDIGHTCAVTGDGRVWCWGDNRFGQLGIGFGGVFSSTECIPGFGCTTGGACDYVAERCLLDSASQPNPRGVVCGDMPAERCDATGLALMSVSNVTTGESHSCAVFDDGTMACWGLNNASQLGAGINGNSTIPRQVVMVNDAVAAAAGRRHTCALSIDGMVRCWGGNLWGQLGAGVVGDAREVPGLVCVAGSDATCVPLTGVVAIAAAADTTCALLGDGTLRCWGYNYDGQLGIGWRGSSASQPQPMPVCAEQTEPYCGATGEGCTAFLTDVVAIDVGRKHACALRGDQTTVCWGDNEDKQLGNGDPEVDTNSCVPTAVCYAGTGQCRGVAPAAQFAVQSCDELSVEVAP